ncbi:MAG: TonB-dependent receptor [Tannerellaceae bacterium]|nr:TonB-dependent receptor [Tannerellaceae bacterium]
MKEKQKYNTGERRMLSRIWLAFSLAMMCQFLVAQNKTVTGVVMEPNGDPVIGANIIEKGTTNGTITDFDGNFTLGNLSENSVIIVRYIGFNEQEIPVSGQTHITVRLMEATELLDEVVVVGYGTQKKESVIGAISQLSSAELLKTSSVNISQAIAGKLPGVITSQGSGAPGADDAAIYIRGRATFAGDAQPLIMVDGVEREFSQISPDDIESISVLKDASATAVYGVRGANGVILVTTKRGREEKPQVSLTASWQLQSPTRRDTYLDSYNSVVLLEEALRNDGLASQYSEYDIEMFRKSSLGQLSRAESQLYPNVDWYDEILNKTAPIQRYTANVRGGTRRMRYFTSLEYYDQQGLYKNVSNYQYNKSSNTRFQRYSFRANLDFLLTKKMTLAVNFATRFEERSGPNIANENILSADKFNELFYELNHTPSWLFPIQYENGLYGGTAQYQNNIYARLAESGFYEKNNTVNETSFILDYDLDVITKGLKAKAQVSFDYETYYNRKIFRDFATYELIDRNHPENEESYTRYNEDGEYAYSLGQSTTMKLYMEFALNYARTFGKHDVTGLLLYNQNDYRNQAALAERYQGLVGRVTYNYDTRYFAEVNAGYNGSENFAKGNRFGFFPSFSVGWMASNEKFMEKTAGWLSNLKFRASYGEVGNDIYKIGGVKQRFLYQEIWTQLANAYQFGSANGVTGIYQSLYPNVGVTWERAKKYNVAMEAMLWDGLLGVNIDLFKETRKDILTTYQTKANWLGIAQIAAGNLGETKNSGYEIEIKHRNRIGQVDYYANFAFSHAKNEILYKDEAPGKPGYRKEEGHPIGQFYGLLVDGYVTSEDIAGGNLPVSSFGDVQVGDLKYRDMNGDGFIDERDITFIGYSDVPENTYSLSVGAEWKGIALSLMFQGVNKVSRYYDAEAQFAFVDGGKVKEHHLQRWNPAQSDAYNLANAKYPLLHYDDYGNHNQQRNSFFVQDGSFLRLKNVEISYNLPRKLVKNWYMSDLRFFVNATNLITWDKLDGLTDPESDGSNRYPIMKSVNFGVNINF